MKASELLNYAFNLCGIKNKYLTNTYYLMLFYVYKNGKMYRLASVSAVIFILWMRESKG